MNLLDVNQATEWFQVLQTTPEEGRVSLRKRKDKGKTL